MVQVREPSLESLARGKPVFQPPRYMTVNLAVEQLLEIEERRQEQAYGSETLCVGLSRVGADSQQMQVILAYTTPVFIYMCECP